MPKELFMHIKLFSFLLYDDWYLMKQKFLNFKLMNIITSRLQEMISW